MKCIGRGLFVLATVALAVGCEEQIPLQRAAPLVDLGYATYRGSYDMADGVTRFLGIRYAAAPIGELRWKEPRTPPYTEEIQEADSFGNVCHYSGPGSASSPQDKELYGLKEPSEDCLFLNVWTPTTLHSPNQLPVIFWIHGGGYVMGDATDYHGTDLVEVSKNGVVVVTIQYRLGVFGFLAGKEVKKGGALNAGLLDQQFALQWVQEHIHKFGGDPERVTIWGESAGAGSVLQHIIANGGKTSPSLFHNAITSSTFLPSQYAYDHDIPEAIYEETVNKANCSGATDTLLCLRQAETSLLESANVNIRASGTYGAFVFVPVVDGTLIRQRPTEALKERKVNVQDFLAVTNSDEGSLFVDPAIPSDTDGDIVNFVKMLFPEFSDAQADAAAKQYQDIGFQATRLAAILSDSIFVCPTYYLLDAFNQKGFKGEFAIPPASHAQDLYYYWTSLDIPVLRRPEYANPIFTQAFGQAFTDFAIASDPNIKVDPSSITPSWRRWGGGTEMLFNRTDLGEPDIRAIKTSPTLLARCSFWESVAAASSQ